MESLIPRLERMHYAYECPRIAPELFRYSCIYLGALANYRHENNESLATNLHYNHFCLSTLSIANLYRWAKKNESLREKDEQLQSLYQLLVDLLVWDDSYDAQGDAAKTETLRINNACCQSLIYCYELDRSLHQIYTTPFLRNLRIFVHNEIVLQDKALIDFWNRHFPSYSPKELLAAILSDIELLNNPKIRDTIPPVIPDDLKEAYEKASLVFEKEHLKWGLSSTPVAVQK